ncbi:hypothetical protein ACFYUY_00680 [Kitasatospora sp. NPDC004745]|uniref:hypothetical protein n=1 Tax=unclassified Kitasatospora TaxID=2633591 RepID=UPI0033CD9B45
MALRTPRALHVDGRDYRWVVRHLDADHVAVRVWPDGPGRAPRPLEVVRRFDDPWLNFGVLLTAPAERIAEVFQLDPVTPALAADLVRAALAAGWRPEEPGPVLRLVMHGDRADFTLTPPA